MDPPKYRHCIIPLDNHVLTIAISDALLLERALDRTIAELAISSLRRRVRPAQNPWCGGMETVFQPRSTTRTSSPFSVTIRHPDHSLFCYPVVAETVKCVLLSQIYKVIDVAQAEARRRE